MFGLDRMILGDNFNITRPVWCLFIKLTQGLNDSLFQHKFHDWQEIIPHTYNTFPHWKAPTSPALVLREEENACNLGRSHKIFFLNQFNFKQFLVVEKSRN